MKNGFEGPKSTPGNPEELLRTKVRALRTNDFDAYFREVTALIKENPEISKIVEEEVKDEFLKKMTLELIEKMKAQNERLKNVLKAEPTVEQLAQQAKSERVSKWFWRAYAAVVLSLGTIGGLIAYDIKILREHDQKAVQEWETKKFALSVDQIVSQSDTIFNSLKGNRFAYTAHDDLEHHVDSIFGDQQKGLEKNIQNKVIGYIDSINLTKPEVLNETTFEYWKSQNNLPNQYGEVGQKKEIVDIGQYVTEFENKTGEIKKQKETVDSILDAAYENFAHEKPTAPPVQVEEKKPEALTVEQKIPDSKPEQKEDTTGTAERLQFKAHIDSLLFEDYKKYQEVIFSPLADTVSHLRDSLVKQQQFFANEEAKIKARIKKECEQKVLSIQTDFTKASLGHLKEQGGKLSVATRGYLKDYYVLKQVFADYHFTADSIQKARVEQNPDSAVIKSELAEISSDKNQFDQITKDGIEETKNSAAEQEKQELYSLQLQAKEIIDPIQAELTQKQAEHIKQIDDEHSLYLYRYKQKWNSEIERTHSKVAPMQ